MASPQQIKARSRRLQVRTGPAGNRAMGYNPAAKPGPVPKAPSRGAAPAPAPKPRQNRFEGAMQTGEMARRRGRGWLSAK